MIDVKDEILNGDPKYRIRDKEGNIIFDNLTIEQITPIIQEGTPLNKVLFDKIGTNLSEIKSDTSRYGKTLYDLIFNRSLNIYTEEEHLS